MIPRMDPKSFYDETMPGKFGADYERARWDDTPRLRAQREMLETTLNRLVLPHIASAETILEVGPGPGTWTRVLRGKNASATYTLVDISHEMLARAKQALGADVGIEFVESDFTQYQPGKTFDVVFSSRAIEYMPDKKAVAKKVAELLAPGGFGAIVTKMPKPLLDRIARRKLSSLHKGQIEPRALVSLFRDAGLTAEAHIAIANVPLFGLPILNKVAYAICKFLPMIAPFSWCAESYIVLVRKS
jgi:ubiquinone/menaquinone biosynthesis C-methylase UbiE